MLLSEAILLGSVETEQGFLPPANGSDGNKACAFEAAVIAMGFPKKKAWAIREIWPWLTHDLIVDVWMKNDSYKWTRPQIAAWVAEKERELGIVDAEVKEEVKEGEHAPA